LVLLTLLHHFIESLKHLLNGLEGRHFMLALLILMVSPFLPMHETNSLQCITHGGFMNRIDTRYPTECVLLQTADSSIDMLNKRINKI